MGDGPQNSAQPLVHLGYYSDNSGKAPSGSGGADLGSVGDGWGVWTLLAFIGAVAATVALMVQHDLIGVAVYLAILAIVIIFPMVWGALPFLAVAFPLSIAVMMAFGVAIQDRPYWPRETICLGLFAGGLGIASLGVRLAVVRYFAPGPIPDAQTGRAVFQWDSWSTLEVGEEFGTPNLGEPLLRAS
jgi:hypothetical protein